ncbi:hypothetical protein [Streptomyces antimicrobicus]|uniref:Uncharacterized protein n=1 Tax=Streptomyces antimicrobicus TaxID=2883108 RepID=A0ABS8B661_9ACTN|nr:hypothetical protein [Streptomyces antimicrobicus]MCB5180096.1 hypothetical protein [Streptomyces antimicrobicus]
MGATLLVLAIVIAALVIRTAVAELRDPGAGRRQWRFLRDPRALAAGAGVTLVLALAGWRSGGAPALPWAVLAGVLVAFTLGGRVPPD